MNKVTKQQQQQHPKKIKETFFHSLKKKKKKLTIESKRERNVKGMFVDGIVKTNKLKDKAISY